MKQKRIERYLLAEGEWDTIWKLICNEPMIVDHIYKYLKEKIWEWEYKTIPQAQLDKERELTDVPE